MDRRIVLLRGINLGPRRRVSMPQLREVLSASGSGFKDVRTYVQSGNVVLASNASPKRVADTCRRLICDAVGFDVDVVVRTRDELAEVVARDPLGSVAREPKRYQVSFLSDELEPEARRKLEEARVDSERLVVIGREVYAWHPEGVARSKLWTALAGKGLGVTATARNWSTVTTLLSMADE
jgi:uncharacterized protein (DUF1697 family)